MVAWILPCRHEARDNELTLATRFDSHSTGGGRARHVIKMSNAFEKRLTISVDDRPMGTVPGVLRRRSLAHTVDNYRSPCGVSMHRPMDANGSLYTTGTCKLAFSLPTVYRTAISTRAAVGGGTFRAYLCRSLS